MQYEMQMSGSQANPVLYFKNAAQRDQMLFAVSLLLNKSSRGIEVECVETDEIRNCGLLILGKQLVPYPVLEAIFSSATLRREVETGRLDKVGRFDESAINWDVSKPWIDILAQHYAQEWGEVVTQPEDNESGFRVFITHDVDQTTGREPSGILKTLLHSLGLYGGWPSLACGLSDRAWRNNLERVLDLEARNNINALYFMLSGPYGFGRYSSRYDIRWAQSERMASMIMAAGMSIGLHGSFHAREAETYLKERERLEDAIGREIKSHRNHYLRFDPMQVWDQLEAAGIRYDFSIGFRSKVGFRSGCARPCSTFSLLRQRPSLVVSIPLLFMDTILIGSDREATLVQLQMALKEAKQCKGCVSLLFHPELFLIEQKLFSVFQRVVEMCKELGADMSGSLPVPRCCEPPNGAVLRAAR